jgi:Alkylmercury lyase
LWDDVVHTCGNQRLFCSEECVDRWLNATGNTRGYVMDVDTLWNFEVELLSDATHIAVA